MGRDRPLPNIALTLNGAQTGNLPGVRLDHAGQRGRRQLRTASIVRATAVLILAVEGWTCASSAEDLVKPGKWEFSTLAPGVMQQPPGVQPSPEMQRGPQGLTFSRTECITADNPLPPDAREPSTPRDADHPCTITKTAVNGGTISWSRSCVTPPYIVDIEGIVHYHAETLDGMLTFRGTTVGHPPIERSVPMTARYLGPCDTK
jgi:hypothetical protein